MTVMPSGAVDVCGSNPIVRATDLDGSENTSSPSSSTAPPCGCNNRAKVRSNVDLPQPFGPMMTVKEPGGMRVSSSVMMRREP